MGVAAPSDRCFFRPDRQREGTQLEAPIEAHEAAHALVRSSLTARDAVSLLGVSYRLCKHQGAAYNDPRHNVTRDIDSNVQVP